LGLKKAERREGLKNLPYDDSSWRIACIRTIC